MLKSENKKLRDKKGKMRMRRFEESQKIIDNNKPIVVDDNDECENYTMMVNQKTEDHDWQEVEIQCRRKKRK